MISILAAIALSLPGPVHLDLSQYVGKDLTRLTSHQLDRFTSLLGVVDRTIKTKTWPPDPQWIKQYRVGSIEWLYLGISPGHTIPGSASIQAFGFDSNWNLIKRYEVPIGYRLFPRSHQLYEDRWISQPLLRIKLFSVGPFVSVNGSEFKPINAPETGVVETYAFTEFETVLIRIEDGAGHLISNSYSSECPDIGPDVSERSIAQWKNELDAADPVRQLGFLVWFSGRHLSSTYSREPDVSREPVSESKTFEQLRHDPSVKHTIEKLTNSPNPWIKKQAEYTLERIKNPIVADE
jgi:hypothetical protein